MWISKMICLVSSFLVDRFQGAEYTETYLDSLDTDVQILIPAIVLHELFTGALRSGQGDSIADIRREFAHVGVAPFDADAAKEATIRATLADRGDLINALDILIAGTVRNIGGTVVAVDRDFERVPDLDVHDPKSNR